MICIYLCVVVVLRSAVVRLLDEFPVFYTNTTNNKFQRWSTDEKNSYLVCYNLKHPSLTSNNFLGNKFNLQTGNSNNSLFLSLIIKVIKNLFFFRYLLACKKEWPRLKDSKLCKDEFPELYLKER